MGECPASCHCRRGVMGRPVVAVKSILMLLLAGGCILVGLAGIVNWLITLLPNGQIGGHVQAAVWVGILSDDPAYAAWFVSTSHAVYACRGAWCFLFGIRLFWKWRGG